MFANSRGLSRWASYLPSGLWEHKGAGVTGGCCREQVKFGMAAEKSPWTAPLGQEVAMGWRGQWFPLDQTGTERGMGVGSPNVL